MIGLIIGIGLSFWIYNVVKTKNNDNPWGWIVGTVLLWPVFTFIVGQKYNERGLKIVGLIGLAILAFVIIVLIISVATGF